MRAPTRAASGIGFGVGWAPTVDRDQALMPGNPGDTSWSGMANTFFFCDPTEELGCVFMTQLLPSEAYPLQRPVRTQVYAALNGESVSVVQPRAAVLQ